MEPADFLVDTNNPEALDQTLQQMGAALVGAPNFIKREGYYVARAFNPGFFKFACEQQGYCKIIRQLDELV